MFHPSKSLGQNFLINKSIVDKIIIAAELSKNDTVLEIGPGKGALTEKLIERASRVIAVEYDRKLFELLKEKFKGAKNLELINADILKFEFKESPRQARAIFPERSGAESRGHLKNYKLIANIPYNITGQIFRKFLSGENRPQMLVVMVQKEVGERLLGKKSRSILSLLAELYGKVEKVCDVSPGSFNPPPKVVSMVVKLIKNSPQPSFSKGRGTHTPSVIPAPISVIPAPISVIPAKAGIQTRISSCFEMENKILHLAKIGFSSKRKKLISNLSTGLKIDKKIINGAFLKLGFSENIRAEELSKDDWLKLAEMI